MCAIPRPTDQPLATLSASKHDRPTGQRAAVGDFGWQLGKAPRRRVSRIVYLHNTHVVFWASLFRI